MNTESEEQCADRESILSEQIKKEGVIPVIKKELELLANLAVTTKSTEEEEIMLRSVIYTLHLVVDENRIKELYEIFEISYPEYYI